MPVYNSAACPLGVYTILRNENFENILAYCTSVTDKTSRYGNFLSTLEHVCVAVV